MFSNAEEVLKFIEAEDVKFVDVRFCDLPGAARSQGLRACVPTRCVLGRGLAAALGPATGP